MRKRFVSILFVAMVFMMATIPALATEESSIPIIPNDEDASTFSYNKTITIDFSQGNTWALDFDNEYAIKWRHRNVNVTYNSNTPSNVSGRIIVKLYIDDDNDGIYTPCALDGSYTATISCGESLSFALPYGDEVKNYRLTFQCATPTVTSATLFVQTSS